jgi:hypothetical protein
MCRRRTPACRFRRRIRCIAPCEASTRRITPQTPHLPFDEAITLNSRKVQFSASSTPKLPISPFIRKSHCPITHLNCEHANPRESLGFRSILLLPADSSDDSVLIFAVRIGNRDYVVIPCFRRPWTADQRSQISRSPYSRQWARPGTGLSFSGTSGHPIRVGIVFDTSTSMAPVLSHNREIALEYTQSILRQTSDQAFITSFGSISKLIQPWTSDSNALALSLRRISGYGERTRPGTAIYDSLYQSLPFAIGSADKASTSNFILLFSDGEDNASRSVVFN